MRQTGIEPRPKRNGSGNIIGEIETEVGARKHLLREIRVNNN
jgi:hypothetical protein